MTMQNIADTLCAVVVKEATVDGMRVFAYPIAEFVPHCKITAHEMSWHASPHRIAVSSHVSIQELVEHNPSQPVYPRAFAAFLFGAAFDNAVAALEAEEANEEAAV